MKAKIKFNSLVSEINITKDNMNDFIDYIKKISHKPEVRVQRLLNDPNPIMCYIGDQRVLPGTEVPLNINTFTIKDLQEDSNSYIVEYEIEGKRFFNFTPHDVVFYYNKRNEKIVMKPCSNTPRVYTEFEKDTNSLDIFNKQKKVNVEAPEPIEGVYYIVSQVIYSLLPERKDFIYPNSVHAVRDDNGNVVGVHSFIQR